MLFTSSGAVVYARVDSKCRGCEFESTHTIGEKGSGETTLKTHFSRKNSEPCFQLLLRLNLSMLCRPVDDFHEVGANCSYSCKTV